MKKITLFICLLAMGLANAQYTAISIVGDGVGGWPESVGNPGPVDLHQMTSIDGVHWSFNGLTTSVGSAKFRANNAWLINWGQNAFPAGTGVQDGPSIPTGVGSYNVTFNSNTGAYVFTPLAFPVISITGDGVSGMTWGQDVDMATADGITYKLSSINLVNGAVKFRQSHDWGTNWGQDSFPSGTGTQDGAAIGIPAAGTYQVTFNRTTGAYSFTFPTIALVGAATAQGWPSDPQTDSNQLATTDGVNYTLASITLLTEGAKFRMNNAWTSNWGSAAFPSGTGTQDGANLNCTAGTYSVSFNKATGAYEFITLSTANFAQNSLKVYPNPTSDNWQFSGTVTIDSISILDISGKTVYTATPNTPNFNVPVNTLAKGVYFATVLSTGNRQTLKLIRN